MLILGLPLPDMTVEDEIARLRADPATRMVSVLALVPPDMPDLRRQALHAGCDAVLCRLADAPLLAARIRSLMRLQVPDRLAAEAWGAPAAQAMAEAAASFAPPARICLVADRAETAARWRRQGLDNSHDRITITTRDGAMALMRAGMPLRLAS